MRDALRGVGRNTALARSRARREWDALRWLRARGFQGPRPLGLAERRRCGLLRHAVLVTEAWPGSDLEHLVPELCPSERAALRDALRRFVDALHAAGFRDRNLDPRNLLARRTADGGFAFAKIDSPRHVIVDPGPRARRLAAADHARLAAGLAALGMIWD